MQKNIHGGQDAHRTMATCRMWAATQSVCLEYGKFVRHDADRAREDDYQEHLVAHAAINTLATSSTSTTQQLESKQHHVTATIFIGGGGRGQGDGGDYTGGLEHKQHNLDAYAATSSVRTKGLPIQHE
jgi:hypothetical protein